MYEKIMVAVDGSLSSMNALWQSFRIMKGRITVVCIAPPYKKDLEYVDLGITGTDIQSFLKSPCDKALAAAEKMAGQQCAAIETICEVAKLKEGILKTTEASGCDLLVMGKSEHHLLGRTLPGNVTARVVGCSPTDVLILPRGATFKWKRILLVINGSEYSKKAALRAMALSKVHGGELKVLIVLDPVRSLCGSEPPPGNKATKRVAPYIDELKELASMVNVHPEYMVQRGKPCGEILKIAGEQNVDLLVIGCKERAGLKRWLRGSVTQRVIDHSSCPILVVKR